jgi:hypothetical protein
MTAAARSSDAMMVFMTNLLWLELVEARFRTRPSLK